MSILASVYHRQTPPYFAESGDFRINPNDDPIKVGLIDFEPQPGEFIAKGAYGNVFTTRFRHQLDVARKICNIRESKASNNHDGEEDIISTKCWYRELTFHQSSSHEHIVRLHGFIAINKPIKLHLFLELMTCSFREILHCFPFGGYSDNGTASTPFKKEGEVQHLPFKVFLNHVCSGLQYLHTNNLMHRDLKPGNVLLKAENKAAVVKISDFGTIKVS